MRINFDNYFYFVRGKSFSIFGRKVSGLFRFKVVSRGGFLFFFNRDVVFVIVVVRFFVFCVFDFY